MRKQMEEEIRAQLLANQQLIDDSATKETWDQKVRLYTNIEIYRPLQIDTYSF